MRVWWKGEKAPECSILDVARGVIDVRERESNIEGDTERVNDKERERARERGRGREGEGERGRGRGRGRESE